MDPHTNLTDQLELARGIITQTDGVADIENDLEAMRRVVSIANELRRTRPRP